MPQLIQHSCVHEYTLVRRCIFTLPIVSLMAAHAAVNRMSEWLMKKRRKGHTTAIDAQQEYKHKRGS